MEVDGCSGSTVAMSEGINIGENAPMMFKKYMVDCSKQGVMVLVRIHNCTVLVVLGTSWYYDGGTLNQPHLIYLILFMYHGYDMFMYMCTSVDGDSV